jgi:isoquinoline 1-oxidoreductase beta subunit
VRSTRRAFLGQSAGLTIAFYLPKSSRAETATVFIPNAYIAITEANRVILWITRSEMGQGVRTNLAATLAEELEVDLANVRLEQATPSKRFKGIRLRTSGSGSSSGTFRALRVAGAAAREMLVSAAAQRWQVDAPTCKAELGFVVHAPSSRRCSYGELAAAAALLTVPTKPALKDPSQFRLIGTRLKRIDAPAIATGKAIYGLDVRVPGMLVAVMERCPYLGGKLASFDSAKALAVPGVRHVVPVHSGIFTGVAVVAVDTWSAMKGRTALNVTWDQGPNRNFDSDEFVSLLKANFSKDGYPIRREGDADAVLKSPARQIEAVYEYPFEAHAPVEPMNCIADARSDRCEVWVPSQTPETARDNIVKTLGLDPESVVVHTTLLGGGFGRRLFVDYVDEAVEISKSIGKPVQLVWTREDDMRNGFFHPASVERMRAALSDDGRLLAWQHKSVGSDLSMFGLPSEEEKKDPQHYANDESPWGAFDTPYNFGAMKIDYVPVDCPVPTGAWRAVMYPSRVFAREAFLDEVAHALGKDPLAFRIELLQPGGIVTLGSLKVDRTRMIRVLEATKEKSGWDRPLSIPSDPQRLTGRGLAINIYHAGSYMAQVAEVSMLRDLTGLRVHRVVCVFDCGLAINPAGLEGQVESGIVWGLSAALHGKIDFRGGRVQQSGFHDFPVLRMNEMPLVETHIVPSAAPPGGFGEHSVPHVAPAVSNAIFAACGKRLRTLPFRPASLSAI